MSSDDEFLRQELDAPGASRVPGNTYGSSAIPVSGFLQNTQRSFEPPLNTNGCARSTAILNQRFGPHFNRRFTQPNGAPYPLRPAQESRHPQRSSMASCNDSQERVQLTPLSYHQQSRRPNSLSNPAPPQQPASKLKFSYPVATHLSSLTEQMGQASLPRQPKEPLMPESCPVAWQDVHSQREEKISNQLMAKSMELDEFKRKFPGGTSVKEILTSGWYKDKVTGRLIQGTDPSMLNNRCRQPVRPKALAQPNYTQRSGQQQHLLPVKVIPPPPHSMESAKSHMPASGMLSIPNSGIPNPGSVPHPGSQSGTGTGALQGRQPFTSQFNMQSQSAQQQTAQQSQQQRGFQSQIQRYMSPQRPTKIGEEFLGQESASRMSMLSMAEHTRARLTPTGTRSATPNILRKNRGTEGCSSPMGYTEHALLGSALAPTFDSSAKQANALVPGTTDTLERIPEASMSDTPRKRARKQILVSDHHYQSSHLYSLLQDEPARFEEVNTLKMVEQPPMDKPLPNNTTPIKTQVPYFPPNSMRPTLHEASVVSGHSEINGATPAKKSRGRPRKKIFAIKLMKHPTKPRKPKTLLEEDAPIPVAEIKNSPDDEAKEEEERKALLQALPSNLQDAIKAQKVIDKEHEKNPKKNVRKPRVPKKQQVEEASPLNGVTASLQFLQSIADINPSLLFSGLNSDIEKEQINKKELQSPMTEEDSTSLPPPIATAVATSGTPLTLNFENPPKLVEAPIWTDDSGPLVPISMYQKDKKIERKPMRAPQFEEQKYEADKTQNPEVDLEPIIEDTNKLSKDEKPYYPPIVTKAALKLMPETISMKVEPKKITPLNLDHILKPPPPWAPSNKAKRRMLQPLLRRDANDSSPEETKPVKRGRPNKTSKINQTKLDERAFDLKMIEVMRKYRYQLDRFEAALFNGVSIKDLNKRVYNKVSKAEEHLIIVKLNSKFDDIVRNCATSQFDEHEEFIVSYQQNSIVKRFSLDWESRDTSSRWLSWHEMITNKCVKDIKTMLINKKIKDINMLIGIVDPMINRVSDLKMKAEVMYLASEIRMIYDRLDPRLKYFVEYGQISLPRTLELKLKAIDQRLQKFKALKNKYRGEVVEKRISNWKTAMNDFIGAVIPADKKLKKQPMILSYQNLNRALLCHDAMIDVTMFASRLQVLYFQAHRVYSNPVDLSEIQEVIQSVEDTEYLLILAETKVMLLQQWEANPCLRDAIEARTELIDIYMTADAMNVEKGKLRRLILTNSTQDSLDACEKILHKKVARFEEECASCELFQIINSLPSKKWTEVIKEEEATKRKVPKNEMTGRAHFLVSSEDIDSDYSLEIPPKLLAYSTLGRSLSEMLVISPHTTNIIDEKLRKIADFEKREPRRHIQSIIPLYRRNFKNYQERCKVLNENRSARDIKRVQNVLQLDAEVHRNQRLLKSIRKSMTIFGAVVSEDQLIPYNPATNDEEQLDEGVRRKLREFRQMKQEQHLERRRLVASTCDDAFGDLDLAETRKNRKKKRFAEINKVGKSEKLAEQDNCEKLKNSTSSEESDTNDEVETIIGTIRELNQKMYTTTNEDTKKECQRLLEIHKVTYKEVQMNNRMRRSQHSYKISGKAKDNCTTDKDKDFQFILDSLEFNDGINDDEIDPKEESNYRNMYFVERIAEHRKAYTE